MNLKILRNKTFANFMTGLFISNIGSGILLISYTWIILQITNSSTKVGLLLSISTISGILSGLFSGYLVDKFSLKKVLITCNLTGLMTSLITALIWNFAFKSPNVIYISIFIQGIIWPIMLIATPALIQKSIKRNDYVSAMSFFDFAIQAGVMIGSFLSGFLFKIIGLFGILIIDGATFFIALFLLFFIDLADEKLKENWPQEETLNSAKKKNGSAAFFELVKAYKKVIFLGLILLFPTILFFGFNTILTDFVKNTLKLGPEIYGIFNTVFNIGALVAGLLTANLAKRFNSFGILVVSLILGIVSFLTIMQTSIIPLIFLLIGLFGYGSSSIRIIRSTIIISHIPKSIIGRITSLFHLITAVFKSILPLLIGFIIEITRLQTGFYFLAFFYISALIIVCVYFFYCRNIFDSRTTSEDEQ